MALLQSGDMDIASIESSIAYNAMIGEDLADGEQPFPEIRCMFSSLPTHFIATTLDQEVTNVEQFSGEIVAFGPYTGSTDISSRAVFEALGLIDSFEVLNAGWGDCFTAMGEGQVYAVTGSSIHPSSAITEMEATQDVNFVPLTQEQMDPFFADLREKLVPLIKAVGKAEQPSVDFLQGPFPVDRQKELSAYVMDVMGIDKDRCVLRETEHPFTTEFSKNDVRITTKYIEEDLTSNLYSVVHEGGHAMYELSVDDALIHSPLGHGATTAIHESQSRLWENGIGRSFSFCWLIFPKIKELFPRQMEGVSAEDFFRAVNRAQPSLIRTDADELTYSLHVLVRYEIEKKIFHDEISVEELPAEWNRLYKEYLGIDVPDDTRGVLQDAHWADGAFGYFPSYALGTAYSAQIMASLRKAVDVDRCCERGEFAEVRDWLTEKIYRHGMLLSAEQLIENACGEAFDPSYYTDYLTEKFTGLYRL